MLFSAVWELPKSNTCRRSNQEVEAKRVQCFGENFLLPYFFFFNLENFVIFAPFLQDFFDCLCVQTITPLEHCQWLNKLLSEIWLNFMNKKLSLRFSSMVEVRFILS